MNKFSKVLLIVVGVIAGIIVLLIILNNWADSTTEKISRDMEIGVQKIMIEEEAEIVYTIKNISQETQQVHSIDINSDAFKYAEFIGVNIKQINEYDSFWWRTFEFKKDVAPDETLEIKFDFKPKSADAHLINTDICINTLGTCIGRSFSF